MTFDTLIEFVSIAATCLLFLDFALILYLRDILNPIFDPKFKVNLNRWTWVSWSNQIARTAWYASYVAGSKAMPFLPTAVGYDFRSKVSKKVFLICRVHQISVYIYAFPILTVGTYLTAVQYKPIVASWFGW